jgi:hypothetical protein
MIARLVISIIRSEVSLLMGNMLDHIGRLEVNIEISRSETLVNGQIGRSVGMQESGERLDKKSEKVSTSQQAVSGSNAITKIRAWAQYKTTRVVQAESRRLSGGARGCDSALGLLRLGTICRCHL